MCGLFAWSSNNKDNWNPLNKFKFELLGIDMDSRGGDGCGIAYDNTVCKSEEIKKFEEIWREKSSSIPDDLKFPAIIGHDRKASVGEKSYANTQPIFFEDRNDDNNIPVILAHNGTLLNHEELYKKHNAEIHYKLDTSKMSDSQMLALLLNKVGWSILNEYIGCAALLYMTADDPGTMYVYHGKSSTRKGYVESDERPLYYAIEEDNIWFCSTRFALEKIIRDKTTVIELPFNKVFKVVGNSMTEEYIVNRKDAYQMEFATINTYKKSTCDYDDYGYDGYRYPYYTADTLENRKSNKSKNGQLELSIPSKNNAIKLSEIACMYRPKDQLFWDKGVFLIDEKPADGQLIMNIAGIMYNGNTKQNDLYTFYFWKGNMVKTRQDYIDIIEFEDEHRDDMTLSSVYRNVAESFVYPYYIPKEAGGDNDLLFDNNAVNKGVCDKLFNGVIHPLLTTKEITFKNGEVSYIFYNASYLRTIEYVKYSDRFPEEFAEWKYYHDLKIKDRDKQNNEVDNINDITCECPVCGKINSNECKTCHGLGVVDGKYIDDQMKKMLEHAELVIAMTEQNKIIDIINNMVEDGINILEEPNILSTNDKSLKKLLMIKEIINNE